MGKGISFVDWDSVGDTIARVEHDSGGTSGSVEGEHRLDGDVHGRGIEGLEGNISNRKVILVNRTGTSNMI